MYVINPFSCTHFPFDCLHLTYANTSTVFRFISINLFLFIIIITVVGVVLVNDTVICHVFSLHCSYNQNRNNWIRENTSNRHQKQVATLKRALRSRSQGNRSSSVITIQNYCRIRVAKIC